MKQHLSAWAVAVLLVTLTASGAAASPARVHGQSNPIVIGMPIALSGFINFYDGPFQTGAQIAVDDINKQGGLLGRPLKIVTSDTKSDINQGTRAAIDVVNKGAQFILPTVDYDFGGAAAREAQKRGLIAVSTAGNVLFGKSGIGDKLFNLFQATPTEGAVLAEFIYNNLKLRHPYVLLDTTISYDRDLCRYFNQRWSQLAGANSLAGQDTFQNSDTSIASQLTRLKQAKTQPDAIVICSYPPGGATAIRQLRGAGITQPIVTGDSFDGPFWLSAVPNEANTYVATTGIPTPGRDPNAARRAFFAKYKLKTGKDAPDGNHALAGYAAVQALAIAIKRAGSTDSDKVQAQLEKFHNENLVIGPTTWTPDCHVSLGAPFEIAKMVKGTMKYVTTIKPTQVPKSTC